MLTRWQRMEKYLEDMDLSGSSFTSRQYAAAQGLSGADASEDVQAYLQHQRSPDSTVRLVLQRIPNTRTNAARWKVDQRAGAVRSISKGFASDARNRFMHAIAPDIRQVAIVNPRAAKRAERTIAAIVDGALVVLEQAIEGVSGGDE